MRWRPFLAGFAATVAAGAVGAGAFIYSGLYNVAATAQHTSPVYDAIVVALRRSIALHARGIEVPEDAGEGPLGPAMVDYHQHCVQCHGAPGVPPEDFALGMNPVPMNLHVAVERGTPEEIFWAIKHGIKMTGMPAWDYRFPDEEIWALTAFVQEMALIAPARYREVMIEYGLEPPPIGAVPEAEVAGLEVIGDAENGRRAIGQYGCAMCHQIPGITGRDVHVGPPLAGVGERKYIAGILANTPENMVRWLIDPPAIDPLTAMPDLDVTEEHARDMAAYLRTLVYAGTSEP